MASYTGPQQNHLFLNALKKNKTTGTLVIVGVKTLDKYRHGAGLWQIPLTCPRSLLLSESDNSLGTGPSGTAPSLWPSSPLRSAGPAELQQ